MDWKKISEAKLPWKPNKFFISVLSGKIKLGSSGEKEMSAIRSKMPEINIKIPDISISLFTKNKTTEFAIFLISILNESNIPLCIT